MKVLSNMQVGLIDRINYISLIFNDDTELRIGGVIDYDLDLDCIEYSSISFTTAFIYDELLSNFKKKEIKHIYINILEIDANDTERKEKLIIDIPCRMAIRRYKINGSYDSASNMYVELEGMVL